jgi:hypothetical protein
LKQNRKPGVGHLKIYGVDLNAKNRGYDMNAKRLPVTIVHPPIGDFGIDQRLENFYRHKSSPEFLDGFRAPAR